MKKYRKKEKRGKAKTKLLQIRLSNKEYENVTEFVKKFDVTYRDFILAVMNQLEYKNVLRDGYFYETDQEFAYLNRERWKTQLTNDSKCELCGAGKTEFVGSIVRHHHYGYKGDNAFKVQIVCNKCHGKLRGKPWKNSSWEYVLENWNKKSDGINTTNTTI